MLYQHFFSSTVGTQNEGRSLEDTKETATEEGDSIDNGKKIGARVPIPFVPMLALGALIYYIFLNDLVDAYFLQFQKLFY